MIESNFSPLDWYIFVSYFLLLGITSYIFSQVKIKTSREYFVSANSMPMLGVAVSVLATSQSAATFLGAPEYSYRSDFTFIGFQLSALIGAIFVAYILVPKFYAMRAITVYELLQNRYGESAKKQAGVMFLLGRVLASGARLYIGALAVSMILFNNIEFLHLLYSVSILIAGALAYSYYGGIKSIILSDVIQSIIYVGAGIVVFFYLYSSLGDVDIISKLNEADKLRFIDTSIDGKFSLVGLFSGWLLLNIAAFGLDQDMTQRVLSCKNKEEAAKSLVVSILLSIPIVLLFLSIGALLYVFYVDADVVQTFSSQKITIFMYYILNELPDGLRGLVTVGAIAAALSSTNSVLGAMASVAIEDLYKPYKLKKSKVDEEHFVKASKRAVLFFAVVLWSMALISYFWQRYTDLPLLSFALGVMAFSYSGLIGVFFSAIFTKKDSSSRVLYALIGGFLTVLALQPYIFGISIGFSWQIVIGSLVSFGIMQLGVPAKTPKASF